ncbi:MAG TPA: DUF3870 domain-containing protein [Nitrospiria bacterium]
MAERKNTIVVGGQARLPKELSDNIVLTVLAKMETATGKILEVECLPCMKLVQDLLGDVVLGRNIPDDLDAILNELEKRLIFKGKRALMTAMKDLAREFQEQKVLA